MLIPIKKDTRIFTYAVGGLYLLGVFILFIFSRLFNFVSVNVNSNDIDLYLFQNLTQNFNYLIPVCLIIGFGYLLLAYNLTKWRLQAFNINLGLSLFAFVSVIVFAFSINMNFSSFFKDLDNFPKEMGWFMYIMRGFQLLIGLVSTIFPHFYLGVLYRKMNQTPTVQENDSTIKSIQKDLLDD